MKKYITADPWRIIESSFDPELHPNTESLMSIGNGRLGQRANFEETYTGESLQGSYIAGVYYPDKTRVGWWKNGYPEYFAKVLNSIQWHNIILHIDGELIDLANADIQSYHRELDMQTGLLSKEVSIRTTQGKMIRLRSERFYSLDNLDLAVLRYEVEADDDIDLKISTGLDSDVRNSDSNYDEDFWHDRHGENGYLQATTKKTGFIVGAAYHVSCNVGDQELSATSTTNSSTYATNTWEVPLSKGQTAILDKVSAISSSRYYEPNTLQKKLITTSSDGHSLSYEVLRSNHAKVWKQRWDQNDVIIEGDIEAQQGIRFNIFQLYQTYDGSDSRLNIGPKGFTGEKYGGSTYWDTEAYCLPFYMSTTSPEVARNLLVYRYQHLQKAIENAEKLGFTDGAALYPMVTMNGDECHNEWEITFEEIHRNGAIAYAIFDYIRYTGDQEYLGEYGIEVLVGIARFWAQRVHMSPRRGLYVMLGVTGPNEYENNVDNNWYTNYIARWCLRFTLESLEAVKASDSTRYDELWAKLSLESTELDTWREVIELMYLPEDKHLGIFVQHDGYLDKENVTISDLSPDHRPINQKWSWDRILRSPYI
ncbi:MAG: glycoside hydrolase family 65 protein, partial [Bacteroidota bacterium]